MGLPKGQDRGLTPGEIALATSIFGNSIDYTKVRIHNDTSNCVQELNTTVTPNGELYCANNYCDDFSKENQSHFIHEMTHVWQYQATPISPRGAAAALWISSGFDYGSAYKFTLDPQKDFFDYNIEQMACIMEDYYAYKVRMGDRAADIKAGKDPDAFVPVTAEQLEKGFMAKYLLKGLEEKYKANPNDPAVKAYVDSHTIAFDSNGVPHYTQEYVDKRNKDDAAQHTADLATTKQHDADLLKVLDKFLKDPTYEDQNKHPKPFVWPGAGMTM